MSTHDDKPSERPPPRAADDADAPIVASILLVDDTPANLVALEATLEPLGHRLVKAASGEAALIEVLHGDFAVILMDVQMPVLDGLETAALIKQRTRSRDIPIIFLTAINRDATHIYRGYQHGAVDYLLKPFHPEILRSKVTVFVDLYRQRERVRRREVALRSREREVLERRSEQRFRNVTDAMPQCVWAMRPDGGVYYTNRVWVDYAGPDAAMDPAGLAGAALHPDERPAIERDWHAALRDGAPFEARCRLRHHAGSYRWHLVRAVPERDERGALLGWIATGTDIDEQTRAEQARAEILVREQAARAEAESARAHAEEANRTKDEFLATVSHELRTPLNAILGWTRMLRTGQIDPTRAVRALETIERNATVQTQIIEDILDVSRIITGKLRLEFATLDFAALVEASVEAVRPTAEAKGVVLEVAVDEPAARVAGDPDRLQQVLWNLLSNAIKFTPSHGRVAIRLAQVDSQLELRVEDTGRGIPGDFLPFVFDRFRQADSSSTRTYGGLGLGLAIVRHLVELHGGAVRVESPGEGQGSTFTVTLPIRAVQLEAGAPMSRAASGERTLPASPTTLTGLRVLVVDDEADARELLTVVLEQVGATVTAAGSVVEALERLAAARPDVLVSDIGMPGADGFALIRAVRALASGIELPAVALTAYARAEDRTRVLSAGFQRHLAKPVDPVELVQVVGELAASRVGLARDASTGAG